MTTKRRTRAYYQVTLRSNTDAASVARDLMYRLGDESEPMHVLTIWTAISEGTNVLGATVRYEARGANGNDIWRRICSSTPLSKSQVEVVELATFNMDGDLSVLQGELALRQDTR